LVIVIDALDEIPRQTDEVAVGLRQNEARIIGVLEKQKGRGPALYKNGVTQTTKDEVVCAKA
jgi:hypothetical protein